MMSLMSLTKVLLTFLKQNTSCTVCVAVPGRNQILFHTLVLKKNTFSVDVNIGIFINFSYRFKSLPNILSPLPDPL